MKVTPGGQQIEKRQKKSQTKSNIVETTLQDVTRRYKTLQDVTRQ